MKSAKTQKKCIDRYRWRLLTVAVALLFLSPYTRAQVTIGDGTPPQYFSVLEVSTKQVKGGLRLPHLTTQERNSLMLEQLVDDGLIAAKGLTIYNTSIGCIEYWNGDTWISLCAGSSSFTGGDCAEDMVSPDGGTVSCAITDPNCTTLGQYTFTIINGSGYTTLVVTDAGAGKFNLTFDPNSWASDRQALVMVTSPCGENGIFVFNQEGDTTGCENGIVPNIESVDNITSMCAGGAVYLYLNGYPSGTFIWTLNGLQVGTGHNYMATAPGKYIVYENKIGCPGSKDIQVTLDGTGAPAPVQILGVGNNGEACGIGGTVQLVTSNPPPPGEVIWFRNGEITNKIGTKIDAGEGYWQAVVKNGSCKSVASEGVTVTENTSGGSIPEPTMKINGLTSGWEFCEGGSLFLEVNGTMNTNYTYTWYANNIQIGVGSGIYYPLPPFGEVAIRLRVTGTGCAKEAMAVETIAVNKAPGAPIIESNTKGYLCGGKATLTVVPAKYESYRWFKDGVLMADKNTASIEVDKTGDYTVCAIDGTCVSTVSREQQVRVSDFGTLTWISHPSSANIGETKAYSVSMDFPEGAVYNWTIPTGFAEITNGIGTSSITVRFLKESGTETTNVVCQASNICGTTNTVTQPVTIGSGCTPANIKSTSNEAPAVKKGESVVMSVTAEGTNLLYQWYKGNTPIGGATNASYTYLANDEPGSYGFRCAVQSSVATCSSIDNANFTVTVSPNPADLPTGTGTFSGKTCFDIAFSNDNTDACASLTSRTGRKTTFSKRNEQDPALGSTAPYTGVQVYTFTPSGSVSKVRFDYIDVTGKVIKSLTPKIDYSQMMNITNECKVVVEYKESLDDNLKGFTRQNALKAELYVIYNNGSTGGGTDVQLKLTATLQDCGCCGAETSSGWLEFMCHNLGANESLDPFTRVEGNPDGTGGTLGYLFQWGRRADGHQKRNSPVTSTLSDTDIPDHGNYIESSSYAPYDWRGYGDEASKSRWGNGAQDANPPKGVNDPCPPGWKVPSQQQWKDVVEYNRSRGKLVYITNSGYKIGDALFLPNTGQRRGYNGAGTIDSPNGQGSYWSSIWKTTFNSFAYALQFSPTGIMEWSWPRSNGLAIRCVAE